MNGTSQYGTAETGGGDDLNLHTEWSLFIVAKLGAAPAANAAFWDRSAVGVDLRVKWAGNAFVVYNGAKAASSAAVWLAGETHSVCATEISGNTNIYIDGALSGAADQDAPAVSASGGTTNIGADSAGGNFLECTIYEVIAFKRALSILELSMLHNMSGV